MEGNSLTRQNIERQLKVAHGKVCYSQTTHEYEVQRLKSVSKWIKIIQIVLSAIASVLSTSFFISDSTIIKIISMLSAFGLLILNSIMTTFDIDERISKHGAVTHDLWLIREKYQSVLADYEDIELSKIRKIRDELRESTSRIYTFAPKTSKRSYDKAKKALKEDEEQSFTEKELDSLLSL